MTVTRSNCEDNWEASTKKRFVSGLKLSDFSSDLDVLRDLTPVDEFSGVVGFIELDDFLVVDFVVRLSTRGCFKRFQESLLEVL